MAEWQCAGLQSRLSTVRSRLAHPVEIRRGLAKLVRHRILSPTSEGSIPSPSAASSSVVDVAERFRYRVVTPETRVQFPSFTPISSPRSADGLAQRVPNPQVARSSRAEDAIPSSLREERRAPIAQIAGSYPADSARKTKPSRRRIATYRARLVCPNIIIMKKKARRR
jgi:hypothetical protein